jgi:hypothetical protein
VSVCSVVFREPRVWARMETLSSIKPHQERSIFSSVELLPSPSAIHSTAQVVCPKIFPDKSRAVMILLLRRMSRINLADPIPINSLYDISSTLMVMLRYKLMQVPRARRSLDNCLPDQDSVGLECYTMPSGAVLHCRHQEDIGLIHPHGLYDIKSECRSGAHVSECTNA